MSIRRATKLAFALCLGVSAPSCNGKTLLVGQLPRDTGRGDAGVDSAEVGVAKDAALSDVRAPELGVDAAVPADAPSPGDAAGDVSADAAADAAADVPADGAADAPPDAVADARLDGAPMDRQPGLSVGVGGAVSFRIAPAEENRLSGAPETACLNHKYRYLPLPVVIDQRTPHEIGAQWNCDAAFYLGDKAEAKVALTPDLHTFTLQLPSGYHCTAFGLYGADSVAEDLQGCTATVDVTAESAAANDSQVFIWFYVKANDLFACRMDDDCETDWCGCFNHQGSAVCLPSPSYTKDCSDGGAGN